MADLVAVDVLVVCAVSVTALKQFFRRFLQPTSHHEFRKYVDRDCVSRRQVDEEPGRP
ncbi:hypothetical protein ACAG24_025395 [Mycobacterium sp. pW049]|uniref:hypothetical protein n=1 Tax=[Mycobacterium] bulgaricum TaxID=3238985 RepID=UPI00351ACD81